MTPTAEKRPTVHSVGIQINGKGFTYTTPDNRNAARIYVRRGDHVKWNCNHGNYSVLFKGETPFSEVAVHGRKNMDTPLSVVTGEPGSYHYAVTVALPDGGLIVDDPEIIIGD